MALYLIHQGRNGVPVGVWRSPDEYYYPADQKAKETYGINVMKSMGSDVSWDDWIEQLASKFPGPQDQWDTYEADGSLELDEVFQEVSDDTSY